MAGYGGYNGRRSYYVHNPRIRTDRIGVKTTSTQRKMKKLLDMGYPEGLARTALKDAYGSVTGALEILLATPRGRPARNPYVVSPPRRQASDASRPAAGGAQARAGSDKKRRRLSTVDPPPVFGGDAEVELEVGSFLDCRDQYGYWLKSEIIKVKKRDPTMIKVHFLAWESKWDEWMRKTDTTRIAPFGTYSTKIEDDKNRYQVDDVVVVYTFVPPRQWIKGTVTKIKGQHTQVCYKNPEPDVKKPKVKYWFHHESPEICDFEDFMTRLRREQEEQRSRTPSPTAREAGARSSREVGENAPRTPAAKDGGDATTEKEWFEGKFIEVKDTLGTWLPATVTRVVERGRDTIIHVHYVNYSKRYDEKLSVRDDAARIRTLGITIPKSREEIEKEAEENKFRKRLKQRFGLEVVEMKADGNCLFRSFAHQCYGDFEKHRELRQKCYDYIEQDRDFFSAYISEDFKSYVKRQRKDMEWGDHVEIRALMEVLNKRCVIYDMKCTEPIVMGPKGDFKTVQLSYHGKNHYNSLVGDKIKVPVGDGSGEAVRIRDLRLAETGPKTKSKDGKSKDGSAASGGVAKSAFVQTAGQARNEVGGSQTSGSAVDSTRTTSTKTAASTATLSSDAPRFTLSTFVTKRDFESAWFKQTQFETIKSAKASKIHEDLALLLKRSLPKQIQTDRLTDGLHELLGQYKAMSGVKLNKERVWEDFVLWANRRMRG